MVDVHDEDCEQRIPDIFCACSYRASIRQLETALAASEQRVDTDPQDVAGRIHEHEYGNGGYYCKQCGRYDEVRDLKAQLQASEQRVRELEHENAIFREDSTPAVRRAEAQFQRAEASERALERVREALKLLLADVQDYEPWQRPCHAVDVARAALASPGSPQ